MKTWMSVTEKVGEEDPFSHIYQNTILLAKHSVSSLVLKGYSTNFNTRSSVQTPVKPVKTVEVKSSLAVECTLKNVTIMRLQSLFNRSYLMKDRRSNFNLSFLISFICYFLIS